jgi:hypothetical protein
MIYMWVNSIHCEEETDEVGADEPYLIMVSVDLKNTLTVDVGTPPVPATVPLPASSAFLYGAFDDVDAGNTRFPAFHPFWGLNDERALAAPEDAIIIAALMENDSGNPVAARGIVAAQVAATIAATAGADREFRLRRLLDTVHSALQTPTGFPSTDETIEVKELRFEKPELDLAESGQEAVKILRFDGDGGTYTVGFRARNRGQSAWRFCAKCHGMFFDGLATTTGRGRCPAGDSHAPAGFTFFLPHDRPLTPSLKSGFHFCDKCFGMFKRGVGLGSAPGDPGICPAGGGHQAQGYRFALPLSHPGPGQDDWVRCGKCRILFWNGEANKGVCPAGDGHVRANTLSGQPEESLRLDFEP